MLYGTFIKLCSFVDSVSSDLSKKKQNNQMNSCSDGWWPNFIKVTGYFFGLIIKLVIQFLQDQFTSSSYFALFFLIQIPS